MVLCATTALAGVVPWSCVCGARGRFGGVGAGAGCCVFSVSPCPPRVSCAVCGGPSCLGVPYPRSLVRHSMRSVRSAGSVRLPFWFFPRGLCVCVRSRSRGVRAPPPHPRVGVARAPRAVPVLGAGRAVPLGPCPSACPASVSCFVWLAWRGGDPVPFPPTWLGAARSPWGGCGRGDPSPTPQRALLRACLARWLGALWGRHEDAWGGRLLPGCGASGVRRSPTPDHSPFRACGRGPLPTGCGCGGCGCGDPSSTPQRALLRAGFARCGGGMRVPGGGASCLGVGRPGSGALPPANSRPFGRAAGSHYPLAAGAGGAGLGTRHLTHSARSCELALRAVGAACGCPGRGPLAWVWGVRGWALSHPRPLVLSGVRPGPTTHWL